MKKCKSCSIRLRENSFEYHQACESEYRFRLYSGDRNNIRIQVKDDGVGFDVSGAQTMFNRRGGFGLFNIRERLKLWDGHMELRADMAWHMHNHFSAA